ncbi:MAG: hypothetical protein OXO50_13765 [Caldilineaceae bacterium]|nr:hypothetical protein [Caldilineaceae bacterium]MDE0196704.1 hypothetical protein [Caldilineaceae bacterium]
MKTKRFTPVFLLLLLLVLAPGSATAQQGSVADSTPTACSSAEVIRPGDTVTDDLSDELAAHTDIAQVSTAISGGKILTAVFHLRDLAQPLTFNRPGVAPGSIEYSWEVWVDLDSDPGTGFMGGFEYLLSAYHTVSEEGNGGKLKASTWSLDIDGPKPVLDAKVELSAEGDTITITGGVPRLRPEVRLAFRSTDALGGSDQVGCFPAIGEPVTLGDCGSGQVSILPGQSAIDDISHSLPPHIDITEVNTFLRDEYLTAVFHLRDLPDRLTFNRTGVPDGLMEYVWEVLVDVDDDKETGIEGNDFALLAFHVARPSTGGTNRTQSIENGTEGAGWELLSDDDIRGLFFGSATLEQSAEANTITLSGAVHGITPQSRLTFRVYDYLHGSDSVGCSAPVFWDDDPPQCSSVEAFTPGDSVTDDVADVQVWSLAKSDVPVDADTAHFDITGIDTSLSGEKLKVVFHLRDLPESLAFNRTGIQEGMMEYRWEVQIDIDNDRNSGFGGGFEYLLSAHHIAYPSESGENVITPVSNGLESNVWRIGSRSYVTFGESSYVASAEANTITLFGEIPGITADSRLAFVTTDVMRGEDQLECHFSMNPLLFPAPCGQGEAMIRPLQTIGDEVSDVLPTHVDIIGISTALSGETLAVIFQLRDVQGTLAFNRAGVGEGAHEYRWGVSIDIDPGQESGQLGLDYEMSATHTVLPENADSSTTASIESKVEAYTSRRIEDGFRRMEAAAIVVSPRADTITLIGDIPGITPDSRLIFNAYDSLSESEHIECQELPPSD